MEFTGKITFIGAEELVGQKQTPKISFVVEEVEGQYPNSLCVDLFGEKLAIIKECKIDDIVKFQVTAKCREYNGRYFNSIGAWKLEKVGTGNGGSAPKAATPGVPHAPTSKPEPKDDLPF